MPAGTGGERRARRCAGAAETTPRVVLRGDYVDGKRLAAELRAVVGDARAVLDLDGASFLGDDAARVLRRARRSGAGPRGARDARRRSAAGSAATGFAPR